MKENYFTIIKDDKKVKCNVLFTFNNNNINYIVYKDDTNQIFASRYIIENNTPILKPIENNSEWDIIDKEIGDRYEQL